MNRLSILSFTLSGLSLVLVGTLFLQSQGPSSNATAFTPGPVSPIMCIQDPATIYDLVAPGADNKLKYRILSDFMKKYGWICNMTFASESGRTAGHISAFSFSFYHVYPDSKGNLTISLLKGDLSANADKLWYIINLDIFSYDLPLPVPLPPPALPPPPPVRA